jgi:hypothetical protein
MSGPLTIDDGGLIVKDPDDIDIYTFDWGTEHLAAAVTIATSSFFVTAVSGDTTTTPLTVSDTTPLGIQAGSRTTSVKVSAGALGSKWLLTNRITTSETPARQRDRSCIVKVEQQ